MTDTKHPFANDIALGTLTEIRDEQRKTNKLLSDLLALSKQRLARTAAPSQGRAPNSEAVATDADLDGQYGDPDVRFDPKNWSGQSYKGRKFSECPSPFLDQLAEVFEYFASKETDEKKIHYKKLDAARARGWSIRNRNKPATAPEPEDDGFGGGGSF